MARIKIVDLPNDMTIDGNTMRTIVGGSVGQAGMQDFSITKTLDSSTPDLLSSCTTGIHIDPINMNSTRTGVYSTRSINFDSGQTISSIRSDD